MDRDFPDGPAVKTPARLPMQRTQVKSLVSEIEMGHLRQCIRATIRYFPER